MGRSHLERMKAIDDYFASVTPEELEQHLIEAGAGRIKSSETYGFRMETNCYTSSNRSYWLSDTDNVSEFDFKDAKINLGDVA